MTVVAAFAAVTMNAQMYVGGSLGYSTSSYDGKTQRSAFTLLPEFGMQFNEKWGAGVELGYSSSTNEASDAKPSNTAFTFAPYARYTALKLGAVNVFADGKFAYTSRNNQTANGDKAVDNKYNVIGLYVQPGIAYNLNKQFSLVAKFGDIISYSSSKPDADGAKATTTFSLLNLSNAVSFGFYYNF